MGSLETLATMTSVENGTNSNCNGNQLQQLQQQNHHGDGFDAPTEVDEERKILISSMNQNQILNSHPQPQQHQKPLTPDKDGSLRRRRLGGAGSGGGSPLEVGSRVMCKWRDGKYHPVKVTERRRLTCRAPNDYEYYVHYTEFNRRLDEWVKVEQLDLNSVETDADAKVEDKFENDTPSEAKD